MWRSVFLTFSLKTAQTRTSVCLSRVLQPPCVYHCCIWSSLRFLSLCPDLRSRCLCAASTVWAWCCWSLTTWWSSCSTLHVCSTSAMRTSRKGIDQVCLGSNHFCSGWAAPLSAKKPPEALISFLFFFSLLFPRSFTLWALLFVIARLLTLTLSVLTFSFGLPRTENQGFSFAEGNFNVLTVRQVYTAISRTVL